MIKVLRHLADALLANAIRKNGEMYCPLMEQPHKSPQKIWLTLIAGLLGLRMASLHSVYLNRSKTLFCTCIQVG